MAELSAITQDSQI